MIEDLLIWVDEQDQETGYGEKMLTHQKEQLHRAFSVFLYDPKEKKTLLHRRAFGKYHSGGLWTNACCSHPRKGESLQEAAVRRLKEELGVDISSGAGLSELGSFQYYEKYTDCAEHEIDHVFLLLADMHKLTLQPDPEEIEDIRWVTFLELNQWMSDHPEAFTAWFPKALSMVCETLPAE